MKYRYLGSSGLLVSRVCLGTMTFANDQWGCDRKTAKEITGKFVDAGGNFIDTADMYSGGESESYLGDILKDFRREELVIATKAWFPTSSGPNARGISRKHLTEALDASLRRLKLDYIDLYQIHGPDPYTPVDETMATLEDMVKSGKVLYTGCSNIYAWQIVKANTSTSASQRSRFISGQYLYNLIRRDVEREILPACADQGMGLLCWSPLASGLLTGKYRGKEKPPKGSRFDIQGNLYLPRFWWDESLRLVDQVADVAGRMDKSMAQVSLAWLLHDRRVSSVIVGIRSVDQLADNIEAGDLDLPEEEYERLTKAMPLPLGYPADWMATASLGGAEKTEFEPPHTTRHPPYRG